MMVNGKAWTDTFSPEATSNDPHRDGGTLNAGAWIWLQVGDKRIPITVTYDNGILYDYVLGHVQLHSSNNRSLLFLNEGE